MTGVTFEVQPTPDMFDYVSVCPEEYSDLWSLFVEPAVAEVRRRFGIQVKSRRWGELRELATSSVPYVLMGPLNPLEFVDASGNMVEDHPVFSEIERIASLAGGSEARINVLTAYPVHSDQALERYERVAPSLIPMLDASLGINTIHPDTLYADRGVLSVSARDVADNIVCETVRLKYHAIRSTEATLEHALHTSRQSNGGNIRQLANLFRANRLYHRAPTDGAVFVRVGDGWLVSQTLTDKSRLTPNDMSLVYQWDEGSNAVEYVGERLPSSDTPELVSLLNGLSNRPKYGIHFHHNGITRGWSFVDHLTSKVYEYGVFSVAGDLEEELQRIGDNWMILREHGVVWMGNTVPEFSAYLNTVLASLNVP